MADRIPVLWVLFSLQFSFSFAHSTEIKSWCNRTPFPDTCQYVINQKHESDDNFVAMHGRNYAEMIVQIAIDKAIHAQKFTWRMGQRENLQLEKKAAWLDCYELIGQTVNRLNRTINGGKCSDIDRQTWLTMAQTNIDTCQMGFLRDEVGMQSNILFPLSNNVSQLIGIALAMNDVAEMKSNGSIRGTFPKFVLAGFLPNVTVAKDGSGNFTMINQAIKFASEKNNIGDGRFVIYVKEGVYEEQIVITRVVTNMTLVGDGIGKTIIKNNKHAGGSTSTFYSATFAVEGDGFIARDITFRNTAGPSIGPAVALRSNSDKSTFYRCSVEGYQDTLYVHSGKQFFKECDIRGIIDFIFGYAAVVFQNCKIYVRRPPQKSGITIAASKRSNQTQNAGIIIQDSEVLYGEDMRKADDSLVGIYLGRPWAKCAMTVIMNTEINVNVNPAGWLQWNSSPESECLYYGEFNNKGSGASTAGRVRWKGYHDIRDASTASRFTVAKFLYGDHWLPSTGVPYKPGL